jgi:histone acetyltransferase (RNA polymerase elongator complex component)
MRKKKALKKSHSADERQIRVPDIASGVNVLRLEETALYFCERRKSMAFWKRKKEANHSEKQESSIPPQPKKINIPRPDKVPKNENEMYSDMANLKNSITKVLEERRNGR